MRIFMKRSCGLLLAVLIIGICSLIFQGQVSAKQKKYKNSVGMEFVLIHAGEFQMGSPVGELHRQRDEIPHQVKISKPFLMQTTEVTRKQWRTLMGRKFFGKRKGGKKPVVKVSWYDCIDFVEKLNELNEGKYRLPTEAEWEYACRAGSNEAYTWGNTITCAQAAYGNSTKSDKCMKYNEVNGYPVNECREVAKYPPNAWGLYDMHGSVWEWCSDWYDKYPNRTVIDPKGPESGSSKVRRGGSWFKHGWQCRSANRNWGHPGTRLRNLGFRVVRDAD